jgi:hypothetical protein
MKAGNPFETSDSMPIGSASMPTSAAEWMMDGRRKAA